MVSQTRNVCRRRGVSLVDTMIAVTILMIALLGTSGIRYAAALDGRRADARTAAARIALMLCESWQGVKGDLTYDPTVQLSPDLTVTAGAGPNSPADYMTLGSYKVTFDRGTATKTFITTLSWKDIQSGLRALNVVIAWASREQLPGAAQQFDGVSVDKSFELTVYTETY